MLPKLSPQDVYQRLQEGEARIVDVREPDEYTRESIDGAVLYPLSVAEKNPLPPSDKLTVFLCRTGRRTDHNAALLAGRAGGNAAQLEGGMRGWVKAGLPVERAGRAPLPLQRQIQIGAGSIVLLGLLLHFIWPMALWLTAFAGAGLLFAGLTGFCGLGILLSKMPWNKQPEAPAACKAADGSSSCSR
ncbi:MAG TPA: rhodanese family protein [Candidatus Avidesulfovibrio excrementigallinarum]|nr:rhodanese family protein [Candidatus Avidesulfovibrio excrementigallinarum]